MCGGAKLETDGEPANKAVTAKNALIALILCRIGMVYAISVNTIVQCTESGAWNGVEVRCSSAQSCTRHWWQFFRCFHLEVLRACAASTMAPTTSHAQKGGEEGLTIHQSLLLYHN